MLLNVEWVPFSRGITNDHKAIDYAHENVCDVCLLYAEFVVNGYKPAMGTIDCKFPQRDGSRELHPGTVGVVDGSTKLLIMVNIPVLLYELEIDPDVAKKDPVLSQTLASLASIRCSYQRFVNPAHHYLHSLRFLFNA